MIGTIAFGFLRRISISSPDSDTLIVAISRLPYALGAALEAFALVFFYAILLGRPVSFYDVTSWLKDTASVPQTWLFHLFGMALLLGMGYQLAIAVVARRFVFDRVRGVAFKNGRRLADIEHITSVEVKGFRQRWGWNYRLALVLQDGTRARIEQGGIQDKMHRAAKSIADFLGVPVIKKSAASHTYRT